MNKTLGINIDMARKKSTKQKQKQKQTVAQRQQVTQKVVVQVDTRRRRKATTKRRPRQQAAAEQPMFMMPPQAAPVPPAFFDPTAMEFNRRLQLLGDDMQEILKIQEVSRRREMERPDGVMLGAAPAPPRTDIPSHIREAAARLGAQLASDGRDADVVGSNIRQLKKEMGMSFGTPVSSPRMEAMSMADLRTPFRLVAPVDLPERHVKAEGSNAPFAQAPVYAVEEKGKQKEIVDAIRESQQMPIQPAVFDVSVEPPVFVDPRERSRGKTSKIRSQSAEPIKRRSARIAEQKLKK